MAKDQLRGPLSTVTFTRASLYAKLQLSFENFSSTTETSFLEVTNIVYRFDTSGIGKISCLPRH